MSNWGLVELLNCCLVVILVIEFVRCSRVAKMAARDHGLFLGCYLAKAGQTANQPYYVFYIKKILGEGNYTHKHVLIQLALNKQTKQSIKEFTCQS